MGRKEGGETKSYVAIIIIIFLLFSQAKQIATATKNLCEAANMMVQGEAQEDRLIAAAKAVATSTTQLLTVCQRKGGACSQTNQRLQVRLE